MKRLTYFAFAIIFCVTLSGCGAKSPTESLDTIGTVDGENIPQALYAYALASVKQGISQSQDTTAKDFWTKGKIDGKIAGDYARDKAKDNIATIYAVRAYAKKAGASMTSDDRVELDKQIQTQIESIGSKEKFQEALTNLGITEAIYRETLINTKYETKAKDIYIKSLTTKDEQSHYKGMKRIKHVLIKTIDDERKPLPVKDIARAKNRINEILKQVKSGKNFEKLIKDYGEDPGMLSNADGYVLGKYDDTYDATFKEAALKLKPGETSGIIKTVFGYHILKCYATIAKNFEKDKDIIESDMWNEKKAEIEKKAKIKWNDEKVKEVPIETAVPATQ